MIFMKSITAKFATTLLIILIIGQSIGTVIILIHTRSGLLDALNRRIDKTATFTSEVSSGAFTSQNYALLDSIIDEIVGDDDINSVHILNSQGEIVVERVKAEDADIKTLNPLLYKKSMSKKIPVTVEGEMFGEVSIDYVANTVNKNLSGNIIMILLYQGIIFLSVGIVIVFLFNKDIKKPVLKINNVIENLTIGDLTTEVPDLGENEIGSIAKGIAFLSERLSMIVSKLNSNTVNVSMAIKQVDIMYKNVINGITNQSKAVKDIVKSIQNANKAHSDVIVNTDKLSSFSTENVSSLLQMKATAEEIATNTQRLYKATEDSYSVVLQINDSAKAVTKKTNEVLSAVEDSSASIEEVVASIKEVEEHARVSYKIADKARNITSDTGMLSVVNAIEGMEKISVEVNNSSEIIKRLGTRSTDIEKVLGVIKDVTEQTNLLSLNAAIIAAQAGEYGKSFSVVANEISALSDRTATSTREIAAIVKSIQKDIKDTVRSIDTARKKVEEGNALVVKIGDAFRETLAASEDSSEMTKAIERATGEQSIGLGQITGAIEEIHKMMQSISKSTVEQENSVSYFLEGIGEVKEVADISKRGTEEQAIGTRVISNNIELTNDKITNINQLVTDQKRLNDDIVVAMEQINVLGTSTLKDMEEVSHSLSTLFQEIELLNKEMGVFKVR